LLRNDAYFSAAFAAIPREKVIVMESLYQNLAYDDINYLQKFAIFLQ